MLRWNCACLVVMTSLFVTASPVVHGISQQSGCPTPFLLAWNANRSGSKFIVPFEALAGVTGMHEAGRVDPTYAFYSGRGRLIPHPLGMQRVETGDEPASVGTYEREFTDIIYGRLNSNGVILDNETKEHLGRLIEAGAKKLVSDGASRKQLEIARRNAVQLADDIVRIEKKKHRVSLEDFSTSICPLYPFC
jgi:hypothetical protein